MKKIIFDTNFALVPAQLKVDIFSEIVRIMDEKYEICVLKETISEM